LINLGAVGAEEHALSITALCSRLVQAFLLVCKKGVCVALCRAFVLCTGTFHGVGVFHLARMHLILELLQLEVQLAQGVVFLKLLLFVFLACAVNRRVSANTL